MCLLLIAVPFLGPDGLKAEGARPANAQERRAMMAGSFREHVGRFRQYFRAMSLTRPTGAEIAAARKHLAIAGREGPLGAAIAAAIFCNWELHHAR